jgi:hypothetical protein
MEKNIMAKALTRRNREIKKPKSAKPMSQESQDALRQLQGKRIIPRADKK